MGESTLGSLVVKFVAETTGFKIGVAGIVGALVGMGAVVGESVKMAGDYQQSLTQLTTTAGELPANLNLISAGMLKMSTDTGTATTDLVKGMYMVESAGFHGAQGLQVLGIAAMGAKQENANLETVAGALTTVLTDYHMSTNQASSAMNGLITAVSVGKMHLQDLTSAMGRVLPLASALGITFPQVAGAISVMTNAGMSARNASMNLASSIRSLAAPNAVAVKSMKSVGLSAQQLKDELSSSAGLAGAIQLIENHVGKTFPAGSVASVQAFKNIMGGATGYNVALMLGGKSMDKYKADVAAITAAMQKGGSAIDGWSSVQKNFNFQLDQAKMSGEALMITLGTALLPTVGKLMAGVSPLVNAFMDWESKTHGLEKGAAALGTAFDGLSKAVSAVVSVGTGIVSFFKNNQVAMDGLVAVLAGVTAGFIAWKASMVISAIANFISLIPTMVGLLGLSAGAVWLNVVAWLALAWPILLIAVIVAAVVFGIIMAVQHWGQIVKWVGGVMSWLGDHVHQIMTAIKNAVGGAFDALGTQMRQSATKIKNDVGGAFSALGTQLHQSATKTKNDVGGAFDNMGTQMRQSATKVKNDVGNIMSGLGTAAHNAGNAIVEAGKWMYAHNTYWKAAVDGMGKAFSNFGNDMRQSATKVKNDVGNIFDQLGTHLKDTSTTTNNVVGAQFKDMGTQMSQSATKTHDDVGSKFDGLGSHLRDFATATKNIVGSEFNDMGTQLRASATEIKNQVGAAFDWLGDHVHGAITALKNNVLDAIGSMVGSVMSWLGTMVSEGIAKAQAFCSGLLGQIQNLAGEMFSAGANLIGMLIGGIASKLGALAGIVGQAAGQLASILGFHSPAKEGPGKDADVWMPNFMGMMTNGLIAGTPRLKAAAVSAAGVVAGAFGVGSSLSLSGGGTSFGSGSAAAASQKNVDITLELDGKVLAQALGQPLVDSIRLKTGLRI